MVSVIGFGAMRIAEDEDEPGSGKAALLHALRLGVNLIDCGGTSFDAQNELEVGQVLKEFESPASATSSSPVLVTRVGALRGRNLEYFFARERRNDSAEVFFLQNGDAVTFAAEHLRAQIAASCSRLGVAKLDAVLLGEGHVSEHAVLGAIHAGTELGPAAAELVSDIAPVLGGRGMVGLEEDLADRGSDDGVQLHHTSVSRGQPPAARHHTRMQQRPTCGTN
jgi:aryl-alcohol dehydrogenase-like predicted oxidoreductase